MLRPTSRPSSLAPLFRHILATIGVVGALAVGAELALIGHWHGWAQLIAFGSVLLVLVGAVLSLWAPSRAVLLGVRAGSVLVAVAGALGSFEHMELNRAFAFELHEDWSTQRLWWAGLEGRIPALAPLVLAQLAILVACSTIGHPLSRPDGHAAGVQAAADRTARPGPTLSHIIDRMRVVASGTGVLSNELVVLAVVLAAVEWRLALLALTCSPLLAYTTPERAGWSATVLVAAFGGARFQVGLLGAGGFLAATVLTRLVYAAIGDRPATAGTEVVAGERERV